MTFTGSTYYTTGFPTNHTHTIATTNYINSTDILINGRYVMQEIDALKREVEELKRIIELKSIQDSNYEVD